MEINFKLGIMNRKNFLKKSALVGVGMATVPSLLVSACKDTPKETEPVSESNEPNATVGFEMAPLAYGYDAFTEVIDAQTMDIHYNKHYKGYTDKLNVALKDSNFKNGSIETILSSNDLTTDIRNNGGGFYNHTLYWDILTPGGKPMPSDFESKITASFNSKEAFINELTDAGKKRFGSGWAWLIMDRDKSLKITSTANQDNPLMTDAEVKGRPLLGIDVWEHAYYLKYQNKRDEYLNQILNIINWENVAKRMT